mmetsp:Transcript_10272/g.15625  ORF Transcript_10272/g.15625 Transcript_10272/m.15625 type:complete len:104 (+) Transcript_10272:1693-2004(+)|eukprot:CAMPEP_0170498756 /NCGR_PEP_ID=MMETSP0208-20121228/28849_1 /TAXON_ID=197538 /ORGANISM="Strombidium inclinatum, Strain S3" /LENGTH=103 /DNA_ID=CAMNT_0010776021 /DNA_START=1612 /DNA_END=1923 /DNA_ORIENTATION=-
MNSQSATNSQEMQDKMEHMDSLLQLVMNEQGHLNSQLAAKQLSRTMVDETEIDKINSDLKKKDVDIERLDFQLRRMKKLQDTVGMSVDKLTGQIDHIIARVQN